MTQLKKIGIENAWREGLESQDEPNDIVSNAHGLMRGLGPRPKFRLASRCTGDTHVYFDSARGGGGVCFDVDA
jgi:hypothetical protein